MLRLPAWLDKSGTARATHSSPFAQENFRFREGDRKKEKEKLKKLKRSFNSFTDSTLDAKVSTMKLFTRLCSVYCAPSPCQLGYGHHGNRYTHSQASAWNKTDHVQMKVTEAKPYHPMVRKASLIVN
eukprot:Plantae.Rhodophyta-Rhodochaete_pulchella.ctg7197.p1 GENE.Plantae.Rhodophyta-Rhodochaete_pulchella.ctg7197~~Plantae.Rhodophyta-Rhodochaete_pulchella.ctg7197.p1  ORF type:complete len:127 (+),score=17.31 Plantae.Rhodophyta-Rhodochaete_pulchella.ctg7197:1417-1797(+)